MGIFPEDYEINVSELINLWIVEGFLKPVNGKNLEEIAEEYLKDLIGRNLIMVCGWGADGVTEKCTIHDLLREVCMTEAQKGKFLCVVASRGLPSMNQPCRIAIFLDKLKVKESLPLIDSMLSESHPRSLIIYGSLEYSRLKKGSVEYPRLLECSNFRLLRVCNSIKKFYNIAEGFWYNLVKSQDIILLSYSNAEFLDILASSIDLMRNLQILDIETGWCHCIVHKILNLSHVRYVRCGTLSPSDHPSGEEEQYDYIMLENLQILSTLTNFRFEEGVLKKIPNMKKLKVLYKPEYGNYKDLSHFSNLGHLQKLESFDCRFYDLTHFPDGIQLIQNLAFPSSLKKLVFRGTNLLWEDMTMIGSLPNLEVLSLATNSFIGHDWNPVEGEFLRLKFLLLREVPLINWNADSIHFPCLKHLVLKQLKKLQEIPMSIGEIPTLSLIEMKCCSHSWVISAKNIVEEQLNFGNEELVVQVYPDFDEEWDNWHLQSSLGSTNFLFMDWAKWNWNYRHV